MCKSDVKLIKYAQIFLDFALGKIILGWIVCAVDILLLVNLIIHPKYENLIMCIQNAYNLENVDEAILRQVEEIQKEVGVCAIREFAMIVTIMQLASKAVAMQLMFIVPPRMMQFSLLRGSNSNFCVLYTWNSRILNLVFRLKIHNSLNKCTVYELLLMQSMR